MQVQNPKQRYKIFKLNEYSNIVFSIIPDQWDIVTVGSMTEPITKGTTPTTEGYGYVNEGIPFFKVENIDDNGNLDLKNCDYISEYVHGQLLRSQLKEGDILFTLAGTLGKVGVVKKGQAPSNVNQALGIVRIKDTKCDSSFLQYILRSSFLEKQINIEKTISAQPNISLTQLTNFRIPKPPLKEQHKIASILSKVDELIQKKDEVIEQTQRLKKGLMQKLLTKGIGHTRFKKSDLGEIPEEWIETSLGSIITLQRGHDLSIDNRRSGNIPVIGANGISGYHDISKARGPGVLIGRSGTLGKVYFIETDYWPLNTSLYVKQFHKGDPKFIYYLMHTIDYKKHNAGTTVPTLNRNLLHPLSVAIPKNIEEQQKIATILTRVEKLAEKEILKKQIISSIKKGLMQKLLTGKIRVKV